MQWRRLIAVFPLCFLLGHCSLHTDYHHTFLDQFAPKYRIIDNHIHTVQTP
jgi:hypothetical protein